MVTVDGLGIEQLAAVHSTKYKPQIDADGLVNIPTTFDARGGVSQAADELLFRNTIHTSLNGVVASHMFGSWDDMAYVVVSPVAEVIDRNGAPAGFNTVDTYWAFDEGAPMRMGEFRVIQPGTRPFEANGFFEEDGSNIYYKTEFTDDDRLEFLQNFLPHHSDGDRMRAYATLCDTLKMKNLSTIPQHNFYIENEAEMEQLEKIILSASGEDQAIIDGEITRFAKEAAVNDALSTYRCPERICGKDYWVGTSVCNAQEFAEELGTNATNHFYSDQRSLEALLNGTNQLGGTQNRASPDHVREFIVEHRDKLPSQSIKLAETIIGSDVYAEAVLSRDRELALRMASNAHDNIRVGPPPI
jgi:hypothetical protein